MQIKFRNYNIIKRVLTDLDIIVFPPSKKLLIQLGLTFNLIRHIIIKFQYIYTKAKSKR